MSTKRTLIIPDTQYPFTDMEQFHRVLKFAQDWQPHEIIHIGDLLDMPAVSTYETPAEAVGTTRRHIEECRTEILQPLRDVVGRRGDIGITFGNHDDRLQRYLTRNAGEVADWPEVQLESLLELPELRIDWVQWKDYRKVAPELIATHGHRVSQYSAYTARKHTDLYGCSVVHGHTHRLGTYYFTDLGGTRVGIEAGTLCDPQALFDAGIHYAGRHPNWQQGFVIIYVDKRTGRFDFDVVWADSKGFRVGDDKHYR